MQSMPTVQVQHAEHLVLAGAEMQPEKVASQGGGGKNG